MPAYVLLMAAKGVISGLVASWVKALAEPRLQALVAYSAAASRWPATSRARGALAGVAIYAGTHGSLLPALGIQRPPWRLSPAAVAWESTSHLVFGVALEAARSALGGRR